MKNMGKKLGSLFLAFAILLTAVVCDVTPVQAASKSSEQILTSVFAARDEATVGETLSASFSLKENAGIVVSIYTTSPAPIKTLLCDESNTPVEDIRSAGAESYETVEYEGTTYYGIYDTYSSKTAGDYIYNLQFSENTEVLIDISQVNNVSIQPKATITAGFTKKLSVSGAKIKKWESRNKAIATVDKNGKVTAKKKGKTKIVATLADGKTKLTCTVTVAANKYSAAKYNVDDAKKGSSAIVPYAAAFDSKGNIVIKAQVINNASYRLGQIKNLKFVVEDENGKVVGTYKAATTNVNVLSQSTKDYTFIIKKADLKKKKVDLRNSLITVKIKNADKAAVYYR